MAGPSAWVTSSRGKTPPTGCETTSRLPAVPIFQKSIFRTECDECNVPFAVNTGGVCEQCRRILCSKHLHGSITHKLLIAFGARMICVRCRAGETPGGARPAPDHR